MDGKISKTLSFQEEFILMFQEDTNHLRAKDYNIH